MTVRHWVVGPPEHGVTRYARELADAAGTAGPDVVHVHFKLPEPLASMVVASALTVDTALKQDDRGFN